MSLPAAIVAAALLTLTAATSHGQDPGRTDGPAAPTPDAATENPTPDAAPVPEQTIPTPTTSDRPPPPGDWIPPPVAGPQSFWWRKPNGWSEPDGSGSDTKDRPAVDPLLPAGIALTTMGMAGTIAGVLMLTFANNYAGPCYRMGPLTCAHGTDNEDKIAGVAGIAAAAGIMLVGIPAWAFGADGGAPEPGKRRRSEKMLIVGVVLTAIGAAGVGVGVGGLAGTEATGGQSNDPLSAALPLTLGASLIATGTSLWGGGAAHVDERALRKKESFPPEPGLSLLVSPGFAGVRGGF